MRKNKEMIRFIDTNNRTLFRIVDGDSIRITNLNGESRDRVCRYIDNTHFELADESAQQIYHIREFAQRVANTGSKVIPLRASLPEQCYGLLPGVGEIIIYKKGETGYYRTDFSTNRKENRELVDQYNERLGVSRAQEFAMQAGSMFGWTVPAADPASYDFAGKPREEKVWEKTR